VAKADAGAEISREQRVLLEDYRKIPRTVIDDLIIIGSEARADEAPGYLKALARIVSRQRTAKRIEE
jgi:hypothetical protein